MPAAACLNKNCCQDFAHTMQARCCQQCKKELSMGYSQDGCRLCWQCSFDLGECSHCRQKFPEAE